MPYRLTYSDGREWGSLTTARAESRYGIPVLVIEGRAYGPADIVSPPWSPLGPNTEIFCRPTFAGGLVASWGSGSRSPEEKRAADRYCRQWPAGPRVSGVVVKEKKTMIMSGAEAERYVAAVERETCRSALYNALLAAQLEHALATRALEEALAALRRAQGDLDDLDREEG